MFGRSIDQMACLFNDSSSAQQKGRKAQFLRFSAFSFLFLFFFQPTIAAKTISR